MVGLLLASAFWAQSYGGWTDSLFSLLTALTIIIGARSLQDARHWRKTVYGLAAVLGLLAIVGHLWPSRWILLGLDLTMLLFFVGSFKLAVRQILFEGSIDGNKIVGSLALYLLIGLIWTELYLILLFFDPTALSGVEETARGERFSRVAYFSLVTLTTLGYGDISPASRLAEILAAMEAVTGVFYMAVFVSSLINSRGGRR